MEENKITYLEDWFSQETTDFTISFSNDKETRTIYIKQEDVPEIADLLSEFLTAKGIENKILTILKENDTYNTSQERELL